LARGWPSLLGSKGEPNAGHGHEAATTRAQNRAVPTNSLLSVYSSCNSRDPHGYLNTLLPQDGLRFTWASGKIGPSKINTAKMRNFDPVRKFPQFGDKSKIPCG
jgi:hypothetical protein